MSLAISPKSQAALLHRHGLTENDPPEQYKNKASEALGKAKDIYREAEKIDNAGLFWGALTVCCCCYKGRELLKLARVFGSRAEKLEDDASKLFDLYQSMLSAEQKKSA